MPKYFFSQFPTTYLTLCFSKPISIEHEAVILDLLQKFVKFTFNLSFSFLLSRTPNSKHAMPKLKSGGK